MPDHTILRFHKTSGGRLTVDRVEPTQGRATMDRETLKQAVSEGIRGGVERAARDLMSSTDADTRRRGFALLPKDAEVEFDVDDFADSLKGIAREIHQDRRKALLRESPEPPKAA
jgi:hypothetical protein